MEPYATRHATPRRLQGSIRALIAGASLLISATGIAATFLVNSPADFPDAVQGDGACETVAGNGVCTLRAAIMEANALPGADTIQLQAISYLLTATGVGDAGYTLKIKDSVAIEGVDRATTIIDANSAVLGVGAFSVASCVGGGTCDVSHPANVVSFARLKIENGTSVTGGGIVISAGAIVTLTDCELSANHALKYGGAVYSQGTLTVVGCNVNGNSTASSPGGGGGLYSSSTLTVRNSSVIGNFAVNGGGIDAGFGKLDVVDSTISGNHADGNGGGIYSAAPVGLYNATIVDNQANADSINSELGGGVYATAGFAFTLANSIVSGNTLSYLGIPNPIIVADDCFGTLTSQGYNIITSVDGTHCTLVGSFLTANPMVGPLQNNGGATPTHALLTGSPAIDAGNNGGCTDNVGAILTTDQRGVARPQGARCDIGAFESDALFADGFEL